MRHQFTPRQTARFWKKVAVAGPDECWLWRGAVDPRGYGRFGLNYRIQFAHRVAYALAHDGEFPSVVCHSCDNPPCCNPAHLWGGTQRDNVEDAMQKGRHIRGERQGRSKLTPTQVQAIRARRATGEPLQVLAADFGVSIATVSMIASGKRWKHL